VLTGCIKPKIKNKYIKKDWRFLVYCLSIISILHLLSSEFKCEKAVVFPFHCSVLKPILDSESEAGFSLAHTSPTKTLQSDCC